MHSGIGRFAQYNRQRKGVPAREPLGVLLLLNESPHPKIRAGPGALHSASQLLTSDSLTPEVLRQSVLTPLLCFATNLGCPQEFSQLLGHGWHSFTSRRSRVDANPGTNVVLIDVLKQRLTFSLV